MLGGMALGTVGGLMLGEAFDHDNYGPPPQDFGGYDGGFDGGDFGGGDF